MHPAISYELAQARIADLRRQARARRPGPRRRTLAVERTAAEQETDSGQPPLLAQQPASGMAGNDPGHVVTVTTVKGAHDVARVL